MKEMRALLQANKIPIDTSSAKKHISDSDQVENIKRENVNLKQENHDVKNEVEALRQAEANSEELLQNGLANYLDLLTARESALNAELNVIDNKLQQLLSVVTLYEALGGGWK